MNETETVLNLLLSLFIGSPFIVLFNVLFHWLRYKDDNEASILQEHDVTCWLSIVNIIL